VCNVSGCKAVSYGGALGGGGVGLEQVQKILGGLFDKLMQQASGGQSGSGSTPTTGTTGQTTGCSQYYQVSQPTSDPCAYYVPPVSGQLTDSTQTGSSISDLLGQLGSSDPASEPISNALSTIGAQSGTGVSQSILSQIQTSAGANTTGAQGATTSTTTTTTVATPNPFSLVPGIRGDIQFLADGATIIAGTRNENTQTEVAGFYGSETIGGGQPAGLVSALCKSRPWATNFLSTIVAPTFFDSLCSWRGYQVGTPEPVFPQVSVTQSAPKPVTTPSSAQVSTEPTVPPKVDVWAVPAAVPLGSRTSVFWNTEGVTDCTVSSPDGSFSQNTLSGGASTVPLVTATTFTISCLAPDGTPVTDYVTVNLSI
jgi:hypothetical protein